MESELRHLPWSVRCSGMKFVWVLLVISLAANVGLVAAYSRRSMDGGPRSIEPIKAASPQVSDKLTPQQLGAISSGNATSLQGMGFTPDVAKMIVLGRAQLRLQVKIQAIQQKYRGPNLTYWKRSQWMSPPNTEQQKEFAAAQREYNDALKDVTGQPNAWFGSRYEYLPQAKREQLERIEADYNEMQQQVWMNSGGTMLPSDEKKIKLLQAEKERDLRASLTTQEYEDYLAHDTMTAQKIQAQFGAALSSEEQYRKIFALQKAFDDQFDQQPMQNTPSFWQQRAEAEKQLAKEIRQAVDATTYEAMRKEADGEFRMLSSLQNRLGLPDGTANTLYASRQNYAEISQGIAQDNNLTPDMRRRLFQDLAARARSDLAQTLGTEGAEVYARSSQWLNMLGNGTAFSVDMKDAPSGMSALGNTVYPYQPKPAASPPAAPAAGRTSN